MIFLAVHSASRGGRNPLLANLCHFLVQSVHATSQEQPSLFDFCPKLPRALHAGERAPIFPSPKNIVAPPRIEVIPVGEHYCARSGKGRLIGKPKGSQRCADRTPHRMCAAICFHPVRIISGIVAREFGRERTISVAERHVRSTIRN